MSITEAQQRSTAFQFVQNWLFNARHRKSVDQSWSREQVTDAAAMLIDYRASVVNREQREALAPEL